MKRWLLRISVLLVLGAIINVAVAWGCVHAEPLNRFFNSDRNSKGVAGLPGLTMLRQSFGYWVISQYGQPRSSLLKGRPPQLSAAQFRALLPRGSAFVQDNNPAVSARLFFYRECLAGWPEVSFRGAVHTPPPSMGGNVTVGLVRSPLLDNQSGEWNELPVIPIWSGFAINTLFYAFVLWLLFAAPFALRRRRRIKRGLCPKCAYPVGTSAVCTECGAAVPPPSEGGGGG